METIYPMQDMGLMESQATRFSRIVDTSNLGGSYNTASGQMGLWDSFKSNFNGTGTGKPNQYGGWNAAGDIMSGLGSLGNIYLGFESLGLLKDQNRLSRSKWKETKKELNHMRAVRDRLNASYAG